MTSLPGPPLPATHWLTRYDEDDGEPYGQVCGCPIGRDHDGAGQLMFTDEEDEWPVDADTPGSDRRS